VTHPLSDLARAADAMGRGHRVAPLRERGARELREATRAFNAMQERLHRYLDSRTRVLAAMSHDLRTPLTRLRLRADAIADPQQQERFVADLTQMDQMVENALGLFRGVGDGEQPSEVAPDDLVANISAQFVELGADVRVESRGCRPLLLKPQAITRCLVNLVDNAIRFGTRATIVVEDGDEVLIRVRDEGPGIPESALEKVFEPFCRLEDSRNRDTGGTGLGLSIARDIAQAHGGSLILGNRSQGGLEAVLTLPRRVADRQRKA
jgi:signal transduction histidine kinase